MAEINTYRDLDLNFTRHPVTNDVSIVSDNEAIKKSIRHLLQLKRYEKPFHPEINPGVYDTFFEPMTPLYVEKLKETIRFVIQKYERRVKLNDVSIRSNIDANSISIFLNLQSVVTQTPISFSVTLSRTR